MDYSKIKDGQVISPDGEILVNVYEDTLPLRQLSDEHCLALYGDVQQAFERVQRAFGAIRGEIEQRMAERGATVIVGDGWQAKRVTTNNYTYAPDLGRRLCEIAVENTSLVGPISKAVMVVPQTYKLNKTGLNQLVKLGEPLKSLIESSTSAVESARVVVERR